MEISIANVKVMVKITPKIAIMLALIAIVTIVADNLMKFLRKGRVIHFANFSTLLRIEGERRFYISPFLVFLKIFILSLLFLIATDSIAISISKPVANMDFVIAIDASPSMLSQDYQPNRLEAAKELVSSWIKKLPPNTYIGVLTFAGTVRPLIEPTDNHLEVLRTIKYIEMLPEPGTAIGDALVTAASMFKDEKREKAVVLVTDGTNNVGLNISEAVRYLHAKKIKVFAIGIGKKSEGERVNESEIMGKVEVVKTYYRTEGADMEALEFIADSTGGKAFPIENKSALDAALEQIFIKNEYVKVNSEYYIIMLVIMLSIVEMLLYARFGVI